MSPDLSGQAVATRLRLVDDLNEFFECDLTGGMAEALGRKPETTLSGPVAAAGIDAPVTEKKTQDLLARAPQSLHRRLAGAPPSSSPQRSSSPFGRRQISMRPCACRSPERDN